jgi:hypothetical protein
MMSAPNRYKVDGFLIQHGYGDQRHQPHERPHLQMQGRPAVNLDLVVVKPVLFVPETAPAETVHGVADPDEMFEKLGGHVPVGLAQLIPLCTGSMAMAIMVRQ